MDRTKLTVLWELVTFAGNQYAWDGGVIQGIYMLILQVSKRSTSHGYCRGSTSNESFQQG
jgi:hypothetical protein